MSERDEHIDAALAARLALELAPVEPAPEARLRMRQRLLGRCESGPQQVVRAAEGAWRPIFPGVRVKTLQRDEAGDSQTTLWRLDPGAAIPAHGHRRDEECLVLEGSIEEGGTRYEAGDYVLARQGSRQEAVRSASGALLLIRGECLPALPVRPVRFAASGRAD